MNFSKSSENGNPIPKSAFIFRGGQGSPVVDNKVDGGDGDDKEKEGEEHPQFKILGATGVVTNHYYWDAPLYFDFSGMTQTSQVPLLREHKEEKIMGFSSGPSVTSEGLVFDNTNSTLLQNELTEEFVQNSRQGYKYQASIYARPTVIEEVASGESADVNGTTINGPAYIQRKWQLRECSICTLGADFNTEAYAYGEGDKISLSDIEIVSNTLTTNNAEVHTMDVNEFKSANPDGYELIFEKGMQKAKEAFSAEKDEWETKVEKQETQLEAGKAKCDALEQTINDMKYSAVESEASELISECVANLELPEGMVSKVATTIGVAVKFADFTTDSELNVASFSEALAKEAKDWEQFSMSKNTPAIGGVGTTKEVENTESTANFDLLYSLNNYEKGE